MESTIEKGGILFALTSVQVSTNLYSDSSIFFPLLFARLLRQDLLPKLSQVVTLDLEVLGGPHVRV